MGSIAEDYCSEVKRDTRLYFALFSPQRRLEPGAIGTLRGDFFIPENATLQDVGIEFDIIEDSSPGQLQLQSSRNVSVSLKVAGETKEDAPNIPAAKAGVLIKFGNESAYVIRSGEVFEHALARVNDVKRRILELHRSGEWPKDRVVVSSVLQCTKADIVISKNSQNTVEIMAKADVEIGETADLGSAEAEFQIISSSGDQFDFLNTVDCTPLFQLIGLKRTIPLVGPHRPGVLRAAAEMSNPLFLGNIPSSEIEAQPDVIDVEML